MIRRFALAAAAVALLAAGCSSSGTSTQQSPTPPVSVSPSTSTSVPTTPTAPDLSRFYHQHLAWHGCGGGFVCANMTVPLDYKHPHAGTMQVAVTRKPASGTRYGALIVNPGGPGASGVDFAKGCVSCFSALTKHFDLASFDPRGTGHSRPVRCLTYSQLDAFFDLPPVPATPAERTAFINGFREFADGCYRRNGSYLSHIATVDSARDMDVFRALLGDAKLTYYGASYGTFLGAQYAQLFPTHIRAMVLDGAVDPAEDTLTSSGVQAIGFETNLNDFLAACVRSGSCPLGSSISAAHQGFDALETKVSEHPEPVGDRHLGAAEFIYGVADGFYSTADWSYLQRGLGAAKRGDGSILMKFFDDLVERNPNGTYSNLQEAFNAISCVDRQTPTSLSAFAATAQQYQSRAPHFAAPIVWSSAVCAYWHVPPVERAGPVSAPGAPPIVVIGTTHDPATPYTEAIALAHQLNGVLVTLEGSGHTAYLRGDGCISSLINPYVISLRVPPAGRRCT